MSTQPIPKQALLEGAFLEKRLPVRAFCTFTKPTRATQIWMLQALEAWLLAFQARVGMTLAAIWSVERKPGTHLHVAIIGPSSISQQDCVLGEVLWRRIAKTQKDDAAQVRVYRDGNCGLAYVLKELGSATEEIGMSDHIAAYYPESPQRFYGRTSSERRKISRIRKQMASGSAISD
jgi:hypothetical protein